MTKLTEKKIINEISSLKKDMQEIKHFFYLIFNDEDFWLYDPKVVKLIKKRITEAEKEYKTGKIQPIEKLWQKLGV